MTKIVPKVFVIDAGGKPLLPCHPARSRRLLRDNKAKVIQVVPFTIQLNRVVENPVGSFTVGIDDGAKYVGVAIVNNKTYEVVFRGQINLRQDVKRLMKQRSEYRRARRTRNLRYRKPRFSNRIACKVLPSIRCRKDSILRFLKDMLKRINIIKVIVEEVKFNHAKYKWGKQFSLVEMGKNYLKKEIKSLGLSYKCVFGWMTKKWRINLNLSKTHANDAISIVCEKFSPIFSSLEYFIKPRRTRVWTNNPTKTCEEKNGFRHFDLVKSFHKTRGVVIGSIRSLKVGAITLRTKWDDNFPVSYKKTKLIQRFDGLIYYY